MFENPGLEQLIADAIATHARVRALTDADGARYWLKVAEQTTGVRRLQKGDARRALRAEEKALDRLSALGLPVTPIVARGPGYLILPDAGPTLDKLLRDPAANPEDRIRGFAAAGEGLARLHEAGYAHGRPAIRDICWRDGRATFIDFERFRDKPRSRTARALDVLLFVHSWFARRADTGPELVAAIDAYRANVDPALWRAVILTGNLLRPLAAASTAVGRFRPRSRDLHAPGRVVAWLRSVQ
ncbi:MAG: phosphotransferase [Beijerinckiaceae bacterium]